MFRRKTSRILTVLAVLALLICVCAGSVFAARELSEPAESSNVNDKDYIYDRWASPIKSHLLANSDGSFTRIEHTGSELVVEEYSSDYGFLSGRTIDMELPIFGGFYEGNSAYFLIFGQDNPTEDDSIEVVRVVKYDKNWNRQGAAGLYGANTVIPFDAGSVRCSEYNGYLYIRTAHEMYKSPDGKNHQANLMMNIRTSDMTMTDSYYQVMNNAFGYVSHSFNQFISTEGGKIVTVDHGDAHPRSIVLMRYFAPAGQSKFMSPTFVNNQYRYVESVDVLPIAGQSGANDTGVSVGGFEVASTSYLIAGNTVKQDLSYDPFSQRNVFVSATSIDNFTSAAAS